MINFLLLIIGLYVLVKGADFLVEGASSLASRFNISPIVIGLTIVAFGTSTPELVVSVTSAIKNNTDIALGNVIGSNIFNILFILGISAMIYPLKVFKNTAWKEIPFSLFGVIILFSFSIEKILSKFPVYYFNLSTEVIIGELNRNAGFLLLCFFIIFIYYTFVISKTSGNSQLKVKHLNLTRIIIYIFGGLMALTIGSQITVDNAVQIAKIFKISDSLIGLTLVAAGTSFPELFTNLAAVKKKNADIAVGNIIGSNIFNIFLILGVTAIIKPIPIRGLQIVDLLVLMGSTILLFISIFVWKRHQITKYEGSIMVIFYLIYLSFIILRG